MRNYITLNGKNSNEINGLLIQELPPISKPQIRTEVEEIDGRDGDIVTKLGFAAYDKEFTVGLYKDFDINAIIAYFNSEGTVVFSNEPDKYYNYQIIDQIDFERLVRYRTATVRMHCQPFKYSNTEGARTLGNKGTASGEGSFITLDNTPEAQFSKIEPKGNATQTTYSGKNLMPIMDGTATAYGITATIKDGVITLNGTTTSGIFIKVSNGVAISTANETSWRDDSIVDNLNGKTISIKYLSGTYPSSGIAWRIFPNSTTYLHQWYPRASDIAQTFTTDTAESTAFELYANNGLAFNNYKVQIQLESGSTATSFEKYVGGTASPNPDYPQPISVVTGENVVKIEGKNLFNGTYINYAIGGTGGNTWFPSSATRSAIISCQPSTTYTVKKYGGNRLNIADAPTIPSDNSTVNVLYSNNSAMEHTITTSATAHYLLVYVSNDSTEPEMQVELGSTATTYEPYQGQSYTISLGTLELAKIGNYQDRIYKEDSKWYIEKQVGKVVLDGTESTLYATSGTSYAWSGVGTNFVKNVDFLTNYASTTPTSGTRIKIPNNNIYFYDSGYTSLDNLKTALASTNLVVYAPLATPTTTEITNEALVAQLEALYNQAHAYKGRTHVAAIAQSGNAPHIIEAEVQRSSDGNITNNGNIVSKPTLTIYGSGNIGVSLNGYQIFEITLGDEEYITIDTAAMEAYKDTLDNLKNRLVNGDYSKFALRPGSNMIEFSGIVSKCVISKYSRWL